MEIIDRVNSYNAPRADDTTVVTPNRRQIWVDGISTEHTLLWEPIISFKQQRDYFSFSECTNFSFNTLSSLSLSLSHNWTQKPYRNSSTSAPSPSPLCRARILPPSCLHPPHLPTIHAQFYLLRIQGVIPHKSPPFTSPTHFFYKILDSLSQIYKTLGDVSWITLDIKILNIFIYFKYEKKKKFYYLGAQSERVSTHPGWRDITIRYLCSGQEISYRTVGRKRESWRV